MYEDISEDPEPRELRDLMTDTPDQWPIDKEQVRQANGNTSTPNKTQMFRAIRSQIENNPFSLGDSFIHQY